MLVHISNGKQYMEFRDWAQTMFKLNTMDLANGIQYMYGNRVVCRFTDVAHSSEPLFGKIAVDEALFAHWITACDVTRANKERAMRVMTHSVGTTEADWRGRVYPPLTDNQLLSVRSGRMSAAQPNFKEVDKV